MTRAGPRRLRHDANHAMIVTELRQCGMTVLDCAAYGMPFDLLVRRTGWQDGRWTAVEVKTHRRASLTPTEGALLCEGGIVLATTTEEVLMMTGGAA